MADRLEEINITFVNFLKGLSQTIICKTWESLLLPIGALTGEALSAGIWLRLQLLVSKNFQSSYMIMGYSGVRACADSL